MRQAGSRVIRLAAEITTGGAVGDAVALAAQSGWVGELLVLGGEMSRSLFFDGGNILGGQTNVATERIGPLLHRLGQLDGDHVKTIEARLAAASRQPGPVPRFGEVAVQLGLVSREKLFEAIGVQTKEIAFGMLLVNRGMLYFFEGFDPARVATHHRLGANSLLMESLQRIDETSYFRERIPSDDHVPAPVPGRSDPPAELRAVFAACDGHRSVKEVARRVALPDFEVLRALGQLAQAGFVRIRPPSAGGPLALIGIFNEAMAIIFRFAQRASVTSIVRQHLSGFTASMPIYERLFAGAGPGDDGRIDPARVAENLKGLGGEGGDPVLAQRLYPYVAYALFAVGSLVSKEDERVLADEVAPLVRRLAPEGENG